MAAAPKARALDLFGLLGKIDRKNYDLWDNLSEAERKEFSPFMTAKWMSGTTSDVQVIFLNTLVNHLLFSIGDHKELMLKVLTACSDGRQKRYTWKAAKSKGVTKKKKSVALLVEYYNYPTRRALEVVDLHSQQDLVSMAEELGYDDAEIKEIKKESK
jgi:hypothetical protein